MERCAFDFISRDDFRSIEANECVQPWLKQITRLQRTSLTLTTGRSSQKSRFFFSLNLLAPAGLVCIFVLFFCYIYSTKTWNHSRNWEQGGGGIWRARSESNALAWKRTHFWNRKKCTAVKWEHGLPLLAPSVCVSVCTQTHSRSCTWPCELPDDVGADPF